jgi:hypothetical protein
MDSLHECSVPGASHPKNSNFKRNCASWHGRGTTLAVGWAHVHRGNWPGGLALSKPMWPQASFKMELDHTEQWVGPFPIFKVFPNCIQLF